MRTFDQKPRSAHTTRSSSLVRPAAPTSAPDPYTNRILPGQPASAAHDFSNIAVYPQGRAALDPHLTLRPPGDRDEHDADQPADDVVRMPARIAHKLAHVVQQQSGAAAGTIQRQPLPAAPAPVAQPGCQRPEHIVVESTGSDRFSIIDVKPPCYACPNSPNDTCPKLAQKIFPPTATGPVQFSWQVRFLTLPGLDDTPFSRNRYVIQKLEKSFTFSTPPAANYAYTPLYWESFELNDNHETDIDYWQFEIPDLTAGTWEYKATLYLTEQLPAGMVVGAVPDAAGAPSTTSEPKRLGRVYGTRRIAGKFDFTARDKWHSFQ